MEKYTCLKESDVVIAEGDGESSSSDDDDEDGDSDDDSDDDSGEDIGNDEKKMDEKLELEVEGEEEEEDIMQQPDSEKVTPPIRLLAPADTVNRLIFASKRLHSWASQKMLHDRLKTWPVRRSLVRH